MLEYIAKALLVYTNINPIKLLERSYIFFVLPSPCIEAQSLIIAKLLDICSELLGIILGEPLFTSTKISLL